MPYLFKQQFEISDLVFPAPQKMSVVIMEPEFYLAQLSARYLKNGGFAIHHCAHVEILPDFLHHVEPTALLINPESYQQLNKAINALANINKNFPKLITVTIAHNLEAETLRELMSAGISGHINRHLSRPQDVAEVIKALIGNQ